jgi:DNA repair exonuclease SbcCD ATPase subunit
VVSRSKTASKGDLIFHIGGVDLTTQSVKETQALIEEKLGVHSSILSRSTFHGQHIINDLLEATDAQLKDELSLLVPLGIWQDACSIARTKARDAKKRLDNLDGMKQLRKMDAQELKNKVHDAKVLMEFRQNKFHEAEAAMNTLLLEIQKKDHEREKRNPDQIQSALETVSKEIQILSDLYQTKKKENDIEMTPLKTKLNDVNVLIDSLRTENSKMQVNLSAATAALDSAKASVVRLEEKWSLDLSDGIPRVLKPPDECPTCHQPLTTTGEGHDHPNFERTIKDEIDQAFEERTLAEVQWSHALFHESECAKYLEAELRSREELLRQIDATSTKWKAEFQSLEDELQRKRDLQNELTTQLSLFVTESHLIAQKDAAKASYDMEKMAFEHANDTLQRLEGELTNAVEVLNQIDGAKEMEENERRILSEVAERCGQKGVQTFVLQNVVDLLEQTAQVYLEHLSDGGQRLELSLEAGEKIIRSAYVRGPDGEFRQRPLSALSGGQWRRCSLALSFAFAELIARRGRLRSSLLVLDEPLTHLDRSGRTKFGEVVRKMVQSQSPSDQEISGLQFSTVILILQDLVAEELEEAFDRMDTVVRENGSSVVLLDE